MPAVIFSLMPRCCSPLLGVIIPGERRALLRDERDPIASNLVVVEHGSLQVRAFEG